MGFSWFLTLFVLCFPRLYDWVPPSGWRASFLRLLAFFSLLLKLRLTPFSSFVVQGGWDPVRNGSSRSGTLITSQSSVMADLVTLLGCPVSEFGELLQPFLTSSPLVGHVY